MATLDPFEIVLFGGTGDLAMRKLIPALFQRFVAGQIDTKAHILAAASSALTREAYVQKALEHCREHVPPADFTDARWNEFAGCLDYQQIDATKVDDFKALKARIAPRDAQTRVWFLSTSPSLYIATAANMAAAGVVTPNSRVVLEKPLGTDRASAHRINEEVAKSFAENQIYRIDHYLGKEPVQNLLALRFGNAFFEPLRDMVQNHMLQLLCILAMEPPANSEADTVRDEKLKVLRALRPIDEETVDQKTVRGQYKAGTIDGESVPAYADEPGVPAGSTTETFVAIKAEIDNWRWAGVPFYLRTGKRLQHSLAEIAITFEDVPLSIFQNRTQDAPNQLVIRLQPDESITLTILAKAPGDAMRLRPVNLALDLGESFKERPLSAYERLLMDVVKGNLTALIGRDGYAWRDET